MTPTSTRMRSSATGSRPPRTSRSRCGICWRPSSVPTAWRACGCGKTPRCSWTMMVRSMKRPVELTRVYHFSAAHQLLNPALSTDDNAERDGQCARPHGHNYYLEVTVAGVPDEATGFAVDLMALDREVTDRLLVQIDHHRLEEAPAL